MKITPFVSKAAFAVGTFILFIEPANAGPLGPAVAAVFSAAIGASTLATSLIAAAIATPATYRPKIITGAVPRQDRTHVSC